MKGGRAAPRLLGMLAFLPLLALALPAQEHILPVPYAVGERMDYDVSFGKLHVGSASMEVIGVDEIRGRDAWHTIYQVHGGLRFVYNVDDTFESWIDRRTGNSLRFKQNLNEGRRDMERLFEIYPNRSLYSENGDSLRASVANPLDDGSFLYFLRTIPLVVGQTYTFERYFRPDRNPVTIKVLRKERIEVPAGAFDAIVVQPMINTKGIFSENGHAEVWLSDDPRHVMLMLKSGLSFGSINLYLKSIRPAPAAHQP
jgi:hypothetical protein